jgi:hypothetical protein
MLSRYSEALRRPRVLHPPEQSNASSESLGNKALLGIEISHRRIISPEVREFTGEARSSDPCAQAFSRI